MEELSRLEKNIRKYTTNYVAQRVYNNKLDKFFMFVFFSKSRKEIVVYDEDLGDREIAKVAYNENGRGVYVSELLVDEEYQQCGLGRLLFNMVIEYAKNENSAVVYGQAAPIDNIKGVSGSGGESQFEKEKEAIRLIYQKLGCKIEKKDNDYEFSIDINENIDVDDKAKFFIRKIKEKQEEPNKE